MLVPSCYTGSEPIDDPHVSTAPLQLGGNWHQAVSDVTEVLKANLEAGAEVLPATTEGAKAWESVSMTAADVAAHGHASI